MTGSFLLFFFSIVLFSSRFQKCNKTARAKTFLFFCQKRQSTLLTWALARNSISCYQTAVASQMGIETF